MCLLCAVHASETSRASTVCGRESSCALDDAREYPDSAGALPLLRDGATLASDVLYDWTCGRAARPGRLLVHETQTEPTASATDDSMQ
eukprot:5433601-Prymnesium_polylepis.1